MARIKLSFPKNHGVEYQDASAADIETVTVIGSSWATDALEEFGLDSDALGAIFAKYQEHYGVPDEVDR